MDSKIVELAKWIVDKYDRIYGARDFDITILARAVIAMAEVVQAAEGVRPLVEWADSQDGKRDLLDPWEVRLVEALDRLRRSAEGGK